MHATRFREAPQQSPRPHCKGFSLKAKRVVHAFSPGLTKTLSLGNISVRFLWEYLTFWVLKATTASVTAVTLGAAEADGIPEIEGLGAEYGGCYWLRMARLLSS